MLKFNNANLFDVPESEKDGIRKNLRKQYDDIELSDQDNCMRLSKLNLIYENIEVLLGKEKYTVLPKETSIFNYFMQSNRILTFNTLNLAWFLLSFKHDENNPIPSHELIMKTFKIGKRTVMKNISELVKSGLIIVEKGKYGTDKRKNTYNVSPFLNLLGSFVEAFREGGDLDIKDMYNDVISGKLKARKLSEEQENSNKSNTRINDLEKQLNSLNQYDIRNEEKPDNSDNVERKIKFFEHKYLELEKRIFELEQRVYK